MCVQAAWSLPLLFTIYASWYLILLLATYRQAGLYFCYLLYMQAGCYVAEKVRVGMDCKMIAILIERYFRKHLS